MLKHEFWEMGRMTFVLQDTERHLGSSHTDLHGKGAITPAQYSPATILPV